MSQIERGAPTAVDLFAGCGGLTLGLRYAGFRVVGAVEHDPLASATYAANHESTRLWASDIRDVPGEQILGELGLKRGELDMLAGCPPCQGFSTLRTLNGARTIIDPRNDLVVEFERLVRELLPKSVMLENVPALATDPRADGFRSVLKALGFNFVEATLNAADFGVPQRRRRYLLLASRLGEPSFGPKASQPRFVHHAIARLERPGVTGDPLHEIREKRSAAVAARIAATPRNGGSRSALGPELQLECHKRTDGFKDVYGRMAWGRQAPTITTGCWNPSKGRFLHPTADRAITLREAALLQGFPSNYQFPFRAGKTNVARLIGNAFPPEFARRHAIALKSLGEGNERRRR